MSNCRVSKNFAELLSVIQGKGKKLIEVMNTYQSGDDNAQVDLLIVLFSLQTYSATLTEYANMNLTNLLKGSSTEYLQAALLLKKQEEIKIQTAIKELKSILDAEESTN